jgi:type VI secretion system secreted protein VgrG
VAQYVEFKVKIGGTEVTPVSFCNINQRIDWHHSFEVVFAAESFTKNYSGNLNKARDFLGEKIDITYKVVLPEVSNITSEFTGIITEATLGREELGSKDIIVSGFSPTILLDKMPNCKSYEGKTLKELVDELHRQIPQNDLKINANPSFLDAIPFIVQYRESNFHFLQRIAQKYGEWCFYSGSELVFGRLQKSRIVDLPIDKNLTSFKSSLRIQNLNYHSVAYNYMDNAVYAQDTKTIAVNDLDPYGQHTLNSSDKVFKQSNIVYSPESFENNSDFVHHHEYEKDMHAKLLVFNSGVSDDATMNVGGIVNIKSESDNEADFGKYIITSISHAIERTGKYQNNFTAIPYQAKTPPPNLNLIRPMAEMQPAVVTNNEDPDKLGRIKVRFFWQSANDSTPWLRIIHSHGGKTKNGNQHGFYFMPENNDEVMIGFENNNVDRPFVIGNLYHKNSKPDHWYNADNNIKAIRTRSGNQIIFNDENGKEEIRILNKDDGSPTNEISLNLSNNGKITIKSQGDLEITAKSIKIQAQDDIVIESGKNTKHTANDYKLESNNTIKVNGQQLEFEGTNTTVKAQTKLQLEGTQTTIDATKLEMQGSGQAELKGAMIKVEGTGTTIVKGALVQIN